MGGIRAVVLLVVAVLVAGCGDDHGRFPGGPVGGEDADDMSDAAESDATPADAADDSTASDAATDAMPDATPDATPDSAPDAMPDATPDAMPDAAPDAPPDAAPDGSVDAANPDDCSPNPCQNGGTCTDGLDSYTCACINGFTGATCQTAPPGTCTLTNNTTTSGTVTGSCELLVRGTEWCKADRIAAGFSGFWLKFSCRVTLTKVTVSGKQYVQLSADSQPDYKSNYFQTTNACYQAYTFPPGSVANPNKLSAQTVVMKAPVTPNTTASAMTSSPGMAINGVLIFGNYAAPGDDIFTEAKTFDRCGAHPQNTGVYHYHSEPYSISSNDSNLIGVLRDGYPVYGRLDPGSATPPTNLDAYGGHTGETVDSDGAEVYHYHVNEQTSSDPDTFGTKQWFITKGTYRGTPAACTGC